MEVLLSVKPYGYGVALRIYCVQELRVSLFPISNIELKHGKMRMKVLAQPVELNKTTKVEDGSLFSKHISTVETIHTTKE